MAKKVIVIGAGIAGVATAIRLAAKGYNVSIFEKNSTAGGKAGLLQCNGYTFDTGPSLFTQPYLLEELFAAAGFSFSDFVSYKAVDEGCHYYFSSGKKLTTTHNRTKLLQAFEQKLNEPAANIEQFLEHCHKAYECIGRIFLEQPLHKPSTWLHKQIIPALKATRWPYLMQNMHQYHTASFVRPETIQLFDRFATYNGSSPYAAPAMLSMIPHIELNQGVFYPKGGIYAVVQAMMNIAKKLGVVFCFNKPVTQIVVKNNSVIGVEINKVTVPADIIVSNVDINFTHQYLLNEKIKALSPHALSSSAIVYYWGVQQRTPMGLHNIIFSEDYKKEFNALFNSQQMPGAPTIYINITSKMEKGMSPEGCENWFVMVNAPANKKINWKDMRHQTKQFIIKQLKEKAGIDISDSIVFEKVLTPPEIALQTNSHMGALYGANANKKMSAFLRHNNEHKKYKGLYFCGGTVHPGGGIPLCLHSAAITSKLILAK